MAELKLGIDLSFVRKRWTEPEDWAKLVKDLGVKYVEFCSDLLDPLLVPEPDRSEIARQTKEEFEKEGITIVVYYTGVITHCLNLLSHPRPEVRKEGIRWCEEALRLATKIGAWGIGGHFDTIPFKDWKDPERKKAAVENLIHSFQSLSRMAKEEGHKFILWEQMYTPSEVPYTLAEADEIYERVNKGASLPVYLTIDVGHTCCQNYPHREEDRNPYNWLEKFASLSPVIHLQQTDEKGTHHWPFTEECNKKGVIEGEKVLAAIEKSGSKENYLILEIFHSLANNEKQILSDLKKSVEYWRKYIKE